MDDQRRIITTDRAGSIWAGITWCSLFLFIVAGIIGMMAQTMLPANLGYPQLHDSGVPTWLTWTSDERQPGVTAVVWKWVALPTGA